MAVTGTPAGETTIPATKTAAITRCIAVSFTAVLSSLEDLNRGLRRNPDSLRG
jgi:hypothetical protein